VIAIELGDLYSQVLILNNLGLIYTRQGDLAEAQRLYEKGLAISQKIGNITGQGVILRNLANVWAGRGDLTRALEFIEQAVEALKATDDVQQLAKAQELRVALQQEIGTQSPMQPHSADEQVTSEK